MATDSQWNTLSFLQGPQDKQSWKCERQSDSGSGLYANFWPNPRKLPASTVN